MKKPETKKNEERKTIEVRSIEVSRVRAISDGTVFFTLTLNGVTIYDCRVVESKNGDFISFPSEKGKDGKYYSKAYAPLSSEDYAAIIAEVEKQLNA